MYLPQIAINIFTLYGIVCCAITAVIAIYSLNNYLKYKNIFYSNKDIENDFLKKQITLLEKQIAQLQNENDELSKIIIGKLK